MNSRRYFLQSINVLNLLVTVAAIGFFIYFLNPLLGTPMSAKVPPPKEISLEMPANTGEAIKRPKTDYTLIGEQNLFHPDRIIPEQKEGKKPPASVPRPELVLHGTMMTSELKIAYIEDKKAAPKSPGRSAPYIVAKEGDNVSGYILKQITENMIMLANGGEQMTLYLDELKVRKGEITGPTKAPPQPTIAPPPGAAEAIRGSTRPIGALFTTKRIGFSTCFTDGSAGTAKTTGNAEFSTGTHNTHAVTLGYKETMKKDILKFIRPETEFMIYCYACVNMSHHRGWG